VGSNHIQLIDQYDRHLNYLRISITDRCNLRCLYCIPSDGIAKLTHGDILTYEEILRLARIAVTLGVDKIRLTGGEPLVRKGIYEFIPRLTALPGLKEVSLTTNGIYLRDNLEKLRSAGIKRINVSLDTLRREKYENITGYDGFQQVWEGIRLARKLKFQPIKINVVVIKGINDDEILDFARLTLHEPYHIRFIEYMPIGVVHKENILRHVPNSLIKKQLSSLGRLVHISKNTLDGPAERFRFQGAPGEIGFISALSNHFCATCNRLRLTPTGNLRSCLLFDQEIDLKGPMRRGASDNELVQIFLRAALTKPHSHYLASENSILPSGHMSAIGG
jgi:cyclic pyranopterin phosphate synthase